VARARRNDNDHEIPVCPEIPASPQRAEAELLSIDHHRPTDVGGLRKQSHALAPTQDGFIPLPLLIERHQYRSEDDRFGFA